MKKKLLVEIKKKIEVYLLVLLIFIAAISTSYFNHRKEISRTNYYKFIDNIYLKKTLNQIINNLEPKYKKINHKIKSGETFDQILNILSLCMSNLQNNLDQNHCLLKISHLSQNQKEILFH